MQIHSKKFLLLSVVLLTVFGGCKKSQKSDSADKSHFSKSSKMKRNKKSADQSVDAFDLDSDAMKSFALDDQLTKHSGSKTASKSGENPIFSWENLNAEESKHQFKTIYFDFDKDVITPAQHASLNYDIAEAKKMIKQGKIIVIEGHACHSAGSAIYNLALSERRARYVAQKFAEADIDASHIKIAPRGQEMPVRKGGSKAEQWVNRRVEIYAIDAQ
jgi:outer membrane protein OmpA-like peptidoglycan-associated protein